MLYPLQPATRQQTIRSLAVPACVGGWNARDSLDSMAPEDAVKLDNWFPREGGIYTRRGTSLHCDTGETTSIGALLTSNINGTEKLIACVNGKLINATAASPSTIGTGFASNAWRGVNFRGRMFLVAPGNAPQDWDHTTLTATSWSGSGLTLTDLFDVTVFNSRLYFLEQNSTSFWYGGTNSVTGTLTEFDLGGLGTSGGKLVGVCTFSNDGGDGPDDLIAFFLSSGEIIVYAGSDPASPSWRRVNVYKAGPLVANGSVLKIGSDVFIICQDGFVPLSRIFAFGRMITNSVTLSDKITYAVSSAVERYAGNTGWQIVYYPKGDMLIFNIPRSSTLFDQYVMNINTRAWCRFRDIHGPAWAIFGNNLYYGSTAGKVYRADTGTADVSASITADAQTAWNYFGDRAQLKRFTMARPILQSPDATGAVMALGTDFDTAVPTNTVSASASGGDAVWDEAVWDTAIWGDATQTSKGWQTVFGLGYAASLRLRVASSSQQVTWFSTNYAFEPGGIL